MSSPASGPRFAIPARAPGSESCSRKRKRVAVHWPVRLFEPMGNKSVESMTENLSSEGFYCLSSRTFKIGERLRCEIVIPEATLGLDGPIVLECQVAVRRVEDL